ncbi:MAG: DUF3781 domain-containing protein, partial [Anaeroplasmataceae bacterium]|nr:DUF3781 domain-containing protein [Anaeroplasmataceae bacterium]
MNAENELLKNLDKVHTTQLGIERIKRNLSLDTEDVVNWSKTKIKSDHAVIVRGVLHISGPRGRTRMAFAG